MYDPTFHRKTLSREFVRRDFVRDHNLMIDTYKNAVLDQSTSLSKIGFGSLNLDSHTLRGKPVYRIRELAFDLILRRINRNIRRITSVRQSDRTAIIKCITCLLQEGLDFRIYKLDVTAFYESIATDTILSMLKRDTAFPKTSVTLLKSFFDRTKLLSVYGMPRGISISATLTEYAMRKFDKHASMDMSIYYYSRFVDDIFIITNGKENPKAFFRQLRRQLFDGLSFNYSKSKYVDVFGKNKGPGATPIEVDFLGYKFTIYEIYNNEDNRRARRLNVDISESKVKKIKSRIVKAFMAYENDGDSSKLSDRIRMLTGNYTIFDVNKQSRRKSGIFYSYSLIDAKESNALKELDSFLRGAILSGKYNPQRPITSIRKKNLLKHTFSNGFKAKVFYHFSQQRLAELLECWTYA